MNLSLRIIINEQGETRDLELDKSTTVGRGGQNRIQIQQGYISSRHAVITQTESGDFVIDDLGSKNGTFINDQPVTEPSKLNEGDVIRFGLAACQVVDGSNSTESATVQPPVSAPVRMVIKGGGRPYLATRKGLVPHRDGAARSTRKKKTYLATKPATRGRFGRQVYDPFVSSKAG